MRAAARASVFILALLTIAIGIALLSGPGSDPADGFGRRLMSAAWFLHEAGDPATPGDGTISGTVLDSAGQPIAGLEVTATELDYYDTGNAITDASGSYTIAGLHPGTYQVVFNANRAMNFLPEWFDDAKSPDQADSVTIAESQTVNGVDATLDPGGSVSGTVTDHLGNPVEGIYVFADASTAWWSYGAARTDASGQYRMLGLASDSYQVEFSPFDRSGESAAVGNYRREWYQDSHNYYGATLVGVAEGSETPGINASLEPGAIISGFVTDESGNPIPGVSVAALYSLGSVMTDGAGHYEIVGLETGPYRVVFAADESEWVMEYYDDKSEFFDANTVETTVGSETSGINAQLALGGKISGRLTGQAGEPLEGGSVQACRLVSWGTTCRYASTDASGNYTIQGLPGDSYYVQFWAPYRSGYVGEYYDNVRDEASATRLQVQVGQEISGIDAELALGGSITGRVTDSNGVPIANVQVNGNPETYPGTYGYDSTDPNGEYVLSGLAGGRYRVQFYGPYGENYLSEYYNDKVDFQAADLVTVVEGEPTSGIDADLAAGGEVSGLVTDDTGQPIAFATVQLEGTSSYYYAQTDSLGNYTVRGVRTGDYVVRFAGQYGSEYVPEYYDNKRSRFDADGIYVTAGARVEGINAQLSVGGAISGRLTNENGDGLAGAYVRVSGFTEPGTTSGFTDSSGNYRVTGLYSGDYRVEFSGPFGSDYLSEYYNDKPDPLLADRVHVEMGSATTGIDAVLSVGGSIAGRVTAEDGTGISNVWVSASSASSFSDSGSATTDFSGNYIIRGVRPGTHKVEFRPPFGGRYLPEYYDNKSDRETADIVSVQEGAATSGINAILELGAVISGHVTDEYGNPIPYASVSVLSDTGGFMYVSADSSGAYRTWGMKEGSYRVSFWAEGYESEFYNDKPDYASADIIWVTQGQVVEGIDAALARYGRPVAQDDSYSVDEDGVLTIDAPGVLSNDYDVDGYYLEAALVTPPSYGELTLNPDGSFEYRPARDSSHVDSFTYSASDGGSSSRPATVTINVRPVNDPPVAAPDEATTLEDEATTVDVVANDSDVDGDDLLVLGVTSPEHGTVLLNSDSSITYTPFANFHGIDQFTYQAGDASGGLSQPALVTIEVLSVNDAPIANDDAAYTSIAQSVAIRVTANDIDADGDPLTPVLAQPAANGTVECSPDGTCTYTPNLGFFGTDSFEYEVRDPHGGVDRAVVTITVGLLPVILPL